MTQEKQTRSKAVASALYPEQIETVEAYAKYTGIGNFSAALRMIINEWAREHNFRGSGEERREELAA